MQIYIFQANTIIQILENITSVIEKKVSNLCMCKFANTNIDSNLLNCSGKSTYFLTYRARLSGTSEVDSQELIAHIADWVSLGEELEIHGILMKIRQDCKVPISSFDEEECEASADKEANDSSSRNSIIIAASITGGILLIIIVLIAIILVFRRITHHGKLVFGTNNG